ncbi:MAG TPA: hypothetical protein VFR66_01140, partial [Burkholderiales bacterium]|nr:hypothetical protein [Burkholderiales bacterium]
MVQVASRIVSTLLIGAAAATAHAQFPQQRPGDATSQPQVPAVQVPSVQTPTITNVPPVILLKEPSPTDDLRATVPLKPGAEPPKSAADAQRLPTDAQKPPARRPLAERERNEFQIFIEASTGRRLPIFGQDLFEDAPSTFAPVENIPVPADYVIGPGDELMVR